MSDVQPCPTCSVPVRTVLTEGGLRIQVEADRRPEGTVLPVKVDGQHRARILTGGQLPARGGAYIDHRKTCGKKPAGPRCPICKDPMDPIHLELDGAHPTCLGIPEVELAQAAQATKDAAESPHHAAVTASSTTGPPGTCLGSTSQRLSRRSTGKRVADALVPSR